MLGSTRPQPSWATRCSSDAPYVLPNPDKKSGALGREDLMNAEYVAGMNSMAASEKRQRDYQ